MKNTLRILPVLAVAALIAGCEGPCQKIDTISGPTLTAGSADFSVIAAMGTSISAGYQSGGVVNRHQMRAFPALFAAQTGHSVLSDGTGDFSFDAINNDGIPTLLEIKSLSPLIISNAGRTSGAPLNMSQGTDYHSLAIPGQLALDVVDSTYYGFGPTAVHSDVTFFNIVYRHRGLGVLQLVRRAPTFLSYEFGANEVLGTATAGAAPSLTLLGSFTPSVLGALATIHAMLPNAKVAITNVPDVTAIPFFTTFAPATIDLGTGTPVALIGPDGSLSPTDLVTLKAGDSLAIGTGFPVGSYNYLNPAAPGNGRPLADYQVLNDAERTATSNAVLAMNASLDSIVANRPWTVKVDLNGLLADIAANGYKIGATTYTADFVTGGLFSLDGVHPNDLAHALICNAMIDAVNAGWGSTIPRLNAAKYATLTSSAVRPASGEDALRGMRLEGLGTGLDMLFPRRP
ncbi:MAG: hypothetical protein IT347_07810 [Candidatus Eisenbacteria bacterium]|nr:hypothetical protein [Candidatus Eisenbacteria bacterium]